MADWAGNNTGPTNDVNSTPGVDVGSSSATGYVGGSASGGGGGGATPDYTTQKYGNTGVTNQYGVTVYDNVPMTPGEIAQANAQISSQAYLSTTNRTDPYAQQVASLSTRAEQDRFLMRNDDPIGGTRNLGIAEQSFSQSQDASQQYLDRPDVYTVTDPSQLALMREGKTAYQAAEELRNRAYDTPGKTDDRYYENLYMQAWTSETGKSAGYHTWAEDTGLPQAANPYEYVADLLTYATYGYPTRDKDVFSPVDYTVLGLPDGRGQQSYMWTDERYDLRGSMDVIARAERSGEMGPYGQLKATSGGMDLSLQTQQAIGAGAAAWPTNFSVWGQSPAQMGRGEFVPTVPAGDRLIGGGKVAAMGTVVPVSETPQSVEGLMASGVLPKPFMSGGGNMNISGAPIPPQKTIFEQGIDSFQSGIRMSFALLPPVGIASDTMFAIAKGKPDELPFYGLNKSIFEPYVQPKGTVTKEQYETNLSSYSGNLTAYNTEKANYEASGIGYSALQTKYVQLQQEESVLKNQQVNIINPPTTLEKIGNIYESANKGIAPYTTDILGIGRTLEATPDINLKKYGGENVPQVYSDVVNFSKGFISSTYQHPIDLAVTYGAGKVFGLGEYGAKYLVAKGAMSELPVISGAGRLLSTPTTAEVVSLGKMALGGYVVYESGMNILAQPTPSGKGEATGRTALQFTGFGIGVNSVNLAEPFNDYTGKGFISGKQEFGPVERAVYKTRVELLARVQPTEEQATLIRSIGQLGGSRARFNEAPIKGEPVFEDATALGKDYGPLIKGVAESKTNPTITKGSMVVASQYPPETVSEAGIRTAKDWDALAYDVGAKYEEIAISSGGKFSGAKEVISSDIADIRPILKGYPGFKPSITPDVRPAEEIPITLMERIIGNPFKNIAGPRGTSEQLLSGRTRGYEGTTNAEAAQAQFGRKTGSALKDFAQDPIGQGYRGQKDLFDTITINQAQKITARNAGVDVTKGEWAENDAAIYRMLELKMKVGSEKGQKSGGETIKLGDWFFKQKQSDTLPWLPEESASSMGVVSPSVEASTWGVGSSFSRTIKSPSGVSSGSPVSRSASYSPSPSSSYSPSPPPSSIPSYSSPPSTPPYSPSLSTPPYSPPPSYTSFYTPPPPSTPPYSPPPLSTPPYSPPPISTPPRSPPPVRSPPSIPPPSPIIPLPPNFPNFPGGSPAGNPFKRGKRAFREYFPIGIDISTFGNGGGARRPAVRKKSMKQKPLLSKKKGK